MTRAVFLDRDGVINRAVIRDGRPYSPTALEEVEWLPGARDAIGLLRDAGYRVIVVTNQPDVRMGLQPQEVVEAIHRRLREVVAVDDIRVCYHIDEDGCLCRKPKPGMLVDAAREWGVDLTESVMVGDRWRDIEAGKAAGCKTVLIWGGYLEREPLQPDAVVQSLSEAAALILSQWAPSPYPRRRSDGGD